MNNWQGMAKMIDTQAGTLPAKVQTLLDAATRHGLVVTDKGFKYGNDCWAITTPDNNTWDSRVLLIWTPGKRDGRLTIQGYRGGEMNARPLTRTQAFIWLRSLAAE